MINEDLDKITHTASIKLGFSISASQLAIFEHRSFLKSGLGRNLNMAREPQKNKLPLRV
jgi:hypothetical protein